MRRIFLALFSVGLLASSACAADKNPVVVMETSMGTIKIELNQDKAPGTVKNFLAYVDDKFYDGTIFHRVIGKENDKKDFMIQPRNLTARPPSFISTWPTTISSTRTPAALATRCSGR